MSDDFGTPSFHQLENRNYLSPTGFYFTVVRAPKVGFFGTQINVPSLNLPEAVQSTYLKDIPRAGDKMSFEDLTLTFMVDEDLVNFMEIQNWMRGLGYPESLDEIYEWQKKTNDYDYPSSYQNEGALNLYSDATLLIYNSQQTPHMKVTFEDVWPSNLTLLQFDSQLTTEQFLRASVTFKYKIYNIEEVLCC